MARSNATTRNCFTAATGISDKDAALIGELADKYNTGDISADYAAAVEDVIKDTQQLRNALQAEVDRQAPAPQKKEETKAEAAKPTPAPAPAPASKIEMSAAPKLPEKKATHTVASLNKALTKFMRVRALGKYVVVVGTATDLKGLVSAESYAELVASEMAGVKAVAFAQNNKAYFIADRVVVGKERGIYLHEVGAHLGLQNILEPKEFAKLYDQIVMWAMKDDKSPESVYAKRAFARADAAQTEEGQLESEHLAYFIEEAVNDGFDPSMASIKKGPVELFMALVMQAFKKALNALNFDTRKLTALDVVDLAYGAAGMVARSQQNKQMKSIMRFSKAAAAVRDTVANFINWFGASTVVNADGSPKVMYHGTARNIENFRPKQAGSIFLTDDPEFAAGFADASEGWMRTNWEQVARERGVSEKEIKRVRDLSGPYQDSTFALERNKLLGSGQNILPLYVRAERPMDFRQEGVARDLAMHVGKMLRKESTGPRSIWGYKFTMTGGNEVAGAYDMRDVYGSGVKQLEKDILRGSWKLIESEQVQKAIKDLGYDSYYVNEDGRTNLAVYDPNQIKSAIGNNGDYSRSDNRIQFSKESSAPATPGTVPPKLRSTTAKIAEVIKSAFSGGLNKVVFTQDLIERAEKIGLLTAKAYGTLYQKRATMLNGLNNRVNDVAALYAEVPEKERGTGAGSVNALIKDSTMGEKWAFDPAWLPSAAADPALKQRFKAMSPEGQAFVQAVFEHGHKTLSDKKRIVLGATVSEYNALIENAKKQGDAAEVAQLEADKIKVTSKFENLFKTSGNQPYAPLKRFGEHVVIAESAQMKAARAANDAKLVAKLEKDGDHYYVDFFESKFAALTAQDKLLASGLYDSGEDGVIVRNKETERERLYGGDGMAAAFTKLRNQTKMRADGSADASKRALMNMVTDMYLGAMAEQSARKSEMRRRSIEGDIDMLRSFTQQGYADAHMLSALAFSGAQGDAINQMRLEKNKGGAAQSPRSQVFNEITARHTASMDYAEPNILDSAKNVASVYYLATSPAYYLQNLTQPWMISLPVMAGRHGYGKAAAALWEAGSGMREAWMGGGMGKPLDMDKVPQDVRKVLETLLERGTLTTGMNREGERMMAANQGAVGTKWNNAKDFIDGMQMKVEVMNRASTAAAAYRMEMARLKGEKDTKRTPQDMDALATDYADRMLRETHGDYSRMAAPRAFNSDFGKLALQFRKYQLLQLTLMAKLARDVYTGSDRTAALKTLGFIFAQTGLLAGSLGLPGVTAVGWVLGKLFGDDDEPKDAEYKLRKWIGDKDTADLILKGVPAFFGADLNSKLGMQNMLSVLPFTDIDMSRKSVTEMGYALATGAVGGLAAKMADGVKAMSDGRYYDGLAKLLPNGVGNLIKAYDASTNGVRNKQGETLLSGEEINLAESVLSGIGLTPTEMSTQQFRRNIEGDFNQVLKERAAKIKQQYVDAIRDGESPQDAREAWTRLQASRRENGFTVQPLSELLKSAQNSRKQERQTINGVQYDKGNRGFAEQLGRI